MCKYSSGGGGSALLAILEGMGGRGLVVGLLAEVGDLWVVGAGTLRATGWARNHFRSDQIGMPVFFCVLRGGDNSELGA